MTAETNNFEQIISNDVYMTKVLTDREYQILQKNEENIKKRENHVNSFIEK